jgi:enamidase
MIAGTCLLGLLASPTVMAGQADAILVGANVLTGDPSRPTAEAIALVGDRIEAVGRNDYVRRLAGPKTRIIDLRGRTVIPGLIDAHVHLLLGPTIVDEGSLRDYERTVLPKTMTGFLSSGITTVRSTGDPLPYIAELRDRLQRGELAGPRLLITGPVLTSPVNPSSPFCKGMPFACQSAARGLENEEQARQAVRELAPSNVDAVKVAAAGGPAGGPPLSDAVVAALVDEARRSKRRIIAHVLGNASTVQRFAAVGFDELVHMPTLAPAEASTLAAVLVGRTMPVTTTLSLVDAYKDATGTERAVISGAPYGPPQSQTFEATLRTTKMFADSGVRLVVGTDLGAGRPGSLADPRFMPGARTLHEIELLHRAGLSTSAVLTAATRNAAEALGIMDKVGTIAEGKLADLVILDGNPLQDLQVLQRPVAVLRGGRLVHGAFPDR